MMQFGFCELAVVPLRIEASDKSEMISQLLFGDILEVIEKSGPWLYVRNFYDGYPGWVDEKQLLKLDKDDYIHLTQANLTINRKNNGEFVNVEGMKINLPAACSFYHLKDKTMKIGKREYYIEGQDYPFTFSGWDNLRQTALGYLSSPYLWGGMTYLGLDCSGFTQVVYKQHGIRLSRDAAQQAEQGEPVGFVSDGRPGDLVFFDNSEGQIIHVGILLDKQQVIHCSGKVRIDEIDHQGIFNRALNTYTHNLRLIKRVIKD